MIPQIAPSESEYQMIQDFDPNDSALRDLTDTQRSDMTGIPRSSELLWPVFKTLRDNRGRVRMDDLVNSVGRFCSLSDAQLKVKETKQKRSQLYHNVYHACKSLEDRGIVKPPSDTPKYRELTAFGMSVNDRELGELGIQQVDYGHEGEDSTPTAWRIRAGSNGELADFFIDNSLAVLGFGQLPDLSEVSSRDEIAELISREEPEATKAQIRNRVTQLWALVSTVRRGDVVITPRQGSSQFALGTVTQEYWYRHDADDMRHAVAVDWKRTDLPRTAVNQDLMNSIDTPGTILPIKSYDGAWRLQQLLETGQDPGPRGGHDNEADLPTLVEQFYSEMDYPTDAHLEQERLRAEWAEKLAPENIASLSREDLNSYANVHTVGTGNYVRPLGRVTQKWIRELDDSQYSRLLESIRDLCWGEGEIAARIDRLVDETGSYRRDAGTKGFAGANVSATLAICRPERFLPVPTQGGKWGRMPMLRELGLPRLPDSTYGQRAVDANDRLRAHLSPYLGDDPLTIGTFLGWLMERVNAPKQPPSGDPSGVGGQELEAVANELLVDVEFLKDIVELLKDKGQVILYGPPGTGKTYLARELAQELAPDETCRALVQFHPSTSYEDFFEGYRPTKTGDDGGIRYELTPGPLKRMAANARKAPGQQHVMIIDEINRGNLPRVLGELLFLLEYRDESVQTLYRPEEPFSLPDNLWFIGTMNTADRSIALVDAALRRRFHFVPFFPDREPMAGLLDRWLERAGEPAWVGQLIEAVNNELVAELDGSHLLLGPSHFMKEYGSSPDEQRVRLRRIWKYNIEPFIEDQFFGRPDQIEQFRFDAVMGRYGPARESDVDAGTDGDDLESADGAEREPAATDGEATAEPGATQPEDDR